MSVLRYINLEEDLVNQINLLKELAVEDRAKLLNCALLTLEGKDITELLEAHAKELKLNSINKLNKLSGVLAKLLWYYKC